MKKDFCVMYIIRHGETEWNKDKIIMGHSDAPLTHAGLRQAGELALLLAPVDFSAVYSSDSTRAVRTAEIVTHDRSLSVKKSARLRERNFDRFEGMPDDLYRQENREDFVKMDALGIGERLKFRIAGSVESDDSLVTRVISELQDIAATHIGERVLISTHGGPIRHLLMKMGFAPYGSLPGGSFKNAGYIIVASDGKEITISEVHGLKKQED